MDRPPLAALVAIATLASIAPALANPVVGLEAAIEVQVAAAQEAPDDAENAWPELERLLNRFARVEAAAAERFGLDYVSAQTYRTLLGEPILDENDRETARSILDVLETTGFFEEVAGLADRPLFVRPIPEGELPVEIRQMPSLSALRNLAEALNARAALALRSGEAEEAAEAVSSALMLARAAAPQDLVSLLTAAAIDELVGGTIRDWIVASHAESSPPPAEGVRLLLGVVEAQDARPESEHLVRVSELRLEDALMRAFGPDGLILPEAVADMAGVNGQLPLNLEEFANRAEHDIFVQEIIGLWRENARVLPRDRSDIDARINDLLHSAGSGFILIGIFSPSLTRPLHHQDAAEASLHAARIMLALELHRSDHGVYPETLAPLAPAYLAELPSDPFAQDGAYRYERFGEGGGESAVARTGYPAPYILYSVGTDAADGGAPEPRGREAMNTGGRGDRVFNTIP